MDPLQPPLHTQRLSTATQGSTPTSASPNSARGGVPASLSRLLIDQQPGDVVTVTYSREASNDERACQGSLSPLSIIHDSTLHRSTASSAARPPPPSFYDHQWEYGWSCAGPSSATIIESLHRASRHSRLSLPGSSTTAPLHPSVASQRYDNRDPRPQNHYGTSRRTSLLNTAPLSEAANVVARSKGDGLQVHAQQQRQQRQLIDGPDPRASPQLARLGNVSQMSGQSQRRPTHPMIATSSSANPSPHVSPIRGAPIIFVKNRPWFSPAAAPLYDMTDWSRSRIEGYRQGYEDAMKSVDSGVAGVEGRQFGSPVRLAQAQQDYNVPFLSTTAEALPTSRTESHAPSLYVSPRGDAYGSLIPPPQPSSLMDRRATHPPYSAAAHLNVTSSRATRTHPPPLPTSRHQQDYFRHPFVSLKHPHAKEKRQIISCYPCRQRRSKCTGDIPCSACVQRNTLQDCAYAPSVKRRGKARKRTSMDSEDSAESSAMAMKRHRLMDQEAIGEGEQVIMSGEDEEFDGMARSSTPLEARATAEVKSEDVLEEEHQSIGEEVWE